MSELREKLEAAFDGDTESVEIAAVEETVGVVDKTVEEVIPDSGDTAETIPAEGDASGGDAPDESGTAEEPASEGKVEEEVEVETTERVDSELKAPYGWKPAMREQYWTELPEEVKAEVLRREVDIAKGMEIANEARELQREFNAKVDPYRAEMASRNVSPMDAFDNYLQTAYQLRHAAPEAKAQLVAGLINQYGVEVGHLDNILTAQINSGQVPAGAPGADPHVLNAINQAMAPVNQFMQNYQTQVVTQAETQQVGIQEEIKTFRENPANEFYMDVKDDMANLLEAASMRSQNMTLQEAYDRAILLHSDIAEIVSQRKLQSKATERDAAAKAAKAKSVGVESTSPDTTTGRINSQATSLRGALEAAFNVDAME